jgi:hypothetical protein
MQRRRFLGLTTAAGTTAVFSNRLAAAHESAQAPTPPTSVLRYEEWLAARHQQVIPAAHLDAFLQPRPHNQWAKFDPELGYVPSDSIQRDGIDGSRTIYRYGLAGERKLIHYADRKCRLNAYGDSFTQCHQVSDGGCISQKRVLIYLHMQWLP